jgi:hypothetical protein
LIFFKRNKKASVPITLLVIGVFALCALALFTFITSDTLITNSFVGVEKLSELNFKINQYEFLKSQGASLEKIEAELGVVEEDGEKYFILEKERGYMKKMKKTKNPEVYIRYKIPS